MKKMLFAAFLSATVILFALSAEALPVTYNFNGTYGLSTAFNSPSIDFNGATITGYYTIDDSTYYTGPLDLSGVVKYGSGNSLSFNFSSPYGQTFNSYPITGINTHYTLGLTDSLEAYLINQFLLTNVDIQMQFHTETNSDAGFLYFNPISITAASPVPIPGALVLFGSGLLGLVGIGRRRFKK